MKKFCVFCGQEPESKNREHVIPSWLIRRTGNPNRNVALVKDWARPEMGVRRFAFDAYTFPACTKCNAAFSNLETQAQSIVDAILGSDGVSGEEWSVFLDWLDKVRVGIWLGMIYLNENPFGINPEFHIQRRIGDSDRFVIIYQLEDDEYRGLGWQATNSPVFECMPSCFTLTINNFLFFNASTQFLFSRRLGFPYPVSRTKRPKGGFSATMVAGTGRTKVPLVKRKFPTGGRDLWQPMIPRASLAMGGGESLVDFYDNEFVRSRCRDFSEGTGRVFLKQRGQLATYPAERTKDWVPPRTLPRKPALYKAGLAAASFQEELYIRDAPLDALDEDDRRKYEEQMAGVLAVHRTLTDLHVSQRHLYY